MDDEKKLNQRLLPDDSLENKDTPQAPSKVALLMTSKESSPNMSEAKEGKRRSSLLSGGGVKTTRKPVLDQLFQPRSLGDVDVSPSGKRIKSLIFTILNPKSRQWPAVCFKYFISNIIIVDCIFFVVSTEPTFREKEFELFNTVEGITSSIFLVEYLARLLTITEYKKYREHGVVWGRVRFASTVSSLVDLLSIFPFFLGLATGWELPSLTFLRAFRLLRILKTSGFVQATDAVCRVTYYNRQIMYMSFFVGLFMVFTTSVLLYYLRPRNNYPSDGTSTICSPCRIQDNIVTVAHKPFVPFALLNF
jgi:hypothetical protein